MDDLQRFRGRPRRFRTQQRAVSLSGERRPAGHREILLAGLRRAVPLQQRQPYAQIAVHLSVPDFLERGVGHRQVGGTETPETCAKTPLPVHI